MIVLPYQITGINRLKDRSVSIKLNTPEVSAEQFGQIMTIADYGICCLKGEQAFTKEELEAIETASTKTEYGQSHSKRLRKALFVVFKHDDHGFDSFDAFYTYRMTEMTESVLDELNSIT